MRPLVLALALAVSSSTVQAAPPRPNSPNILVIVLDTVRYDAVSSANTPFLESLKSRSVVFTNAYSTHDFTPPSHFSIMTGLPNGLETAADRVENSVPYQLRKALNYDTFATAANGLLQPKCMPTFRAFNRFYDLRADPRVAPDFWRARTDIDMRLALFDCPRNLRTISSLYYSADRLLPAFAEQIRAARAPYFGFLNLMDAHDPYVPDPDDYAPEASLPPGFTGDPLHRTLEPELQAPKEIKDSARRKLIEAKIAQAGSPQRVAIDLPPESLAIYHQRYLAKIREMDAMLRQFFAALERDGALENTYVIITSDHGESFGEAGLLSHDFGDRGDDESTRHVPLIIVPPSNNRSAATVITRKVSNGSIAPTIYDLAHLDSTALRKQHNAFLRSLAPLFAAEPVRYVASLILPKTRATRDTQAAREREQVIRSLGYMH